MKPRDGVPWMHGSFSGDARGVALAARAFALTLALVVTLAAPVAGQRPWPVSLVARPGSHEAVKQRALWTNCQGVSLMTRVNSDTDLSVESVWNAAEAALRSARVYFQPSLEFPEGSSPWTVSVLVSGVGPANYVETGLLETVYDDRDDSGPPERNAGVHTVMTYRTTTISTNADAADLLAMVREQMDSFLVDYLRVHADCAGGPL